MIGPVPEVAITPEEEELIDQLVALYRADLAVFELFAKQLRSLAEHPSLQKLYHSFKLRVKDPEHLQHKLRRRILKSKLEGKGFDVSNNNLFERVTDLVGLRLLHLHTSEFPEINTVLTNLLEEVKFKLLEGPEARTWDDEYRAYFASIGVNVVTSTRLYTSVHYVVEAGMKTKRTGEIQVRTLAEELWGEVDHRINYPDPNFKLSCREQIKVLARATSGCTRLVDSIFRAHNEGANPPIAGAP